VPGSRRRILGLGDSNTYGRYLEPSEAYRLQLRDVIRRAAAEAGATLVDVASRMRALCPTARCPELLFADQHPTAAGSALAAETIEAWLAARWP
jgi:lysophospholipase L1-like esterase